MLSVINIQQQVEQKILEDDKEYSVQINLILVINYLTCYKLKIAMKF